MRPTNCILDTGAVPTLLCKQRSEHEGMISVCIYQKRRLRNLKIQNVKAVGTVMLYLHMRETHVHVVFVILGSFAVNAVLGTWYIENFVKRTSSAKRKIVAYNINPVQTLMIYEVPNGKKEQQEQVT